MKCDQVRELFSVYLDRELNEQLRSMFDRHVQTCYACALQMNSLRRSLAALKEHGPVQASEDFEERLFRRLRALEKPPAAPSLPALRNLSTWVPLAAAAGLLLIVIPVLISLGNRLSDRDRRIMDLEAQLAKTRKTAPRPVPAPSPPENPEPSEVIDDFIRRYELVPFRGGFAPREIVAQLQSGRCFVDGEWMPKEALIAKLTSELEKPRKEAAAPAPSRARPVEELVREWLDRNGYVRYGDGYVPADVAKILRNREAPDPEEILKAFMAKHDLIRVGDRVMTRDHAEEIQLACTLARPETAECEVGTLLGGMKIGLPVRRGGIVVYPLLGKDRVPPGEYRALHDVRTPMVEMKTGQALSFRNTSRATLFIPAGTLIAGRTGVRVTRSDLRIGPAGTGTTPVYTGISDGREVSRKESLVAPVSILRRLNGPYGQAALWALTTRLAGALGIAQPSIAGLLRAEAVRERIARTREAFRKFTRAHPDARGYAIGVDEDILFIQVFSDPGLMAEAFEHALASAAFETVIRERGVVLHTQVANTFHELKRFLERAYAARTKPWGGGKQLSFDGAPLGNICVEAATGAPISMTLYCPVAEPMSFGEILEVTATLPRSRLDRIVAQFDLALARAAEPEERIGLLQELSAFGGENATRKILRYTRDPHPAVQEAALQALGNRRDPGAVGPLITLFREVRTDPNRMEPVAACLAALGDPKAVDELLRTLENPDPQIAGHIVPYVPAAIRRLRVEADIRKAMERLVGFYAITYTIYWDPPPTIQDPVRQRYRAAYIRATEALHELTGEFFQHPAQAQTWWRKNGDSFVKKAAK